MESKSVTSNLTLNDLSLVVSIIDACSSRGAFRGTELEEIGRIRGKIAKVVSDNSPKTKDGFVKTED
jgi:hypothetical protein